MCINKKKQSLLDPINGTFDLDKNDIESAKLLL